MGWQLSNCGFAARRCIDKIRNHLLCQLNSYSFYILPTQYLLIGGSTCIIKVKPFVVTRRWLTTRHNEMRCRATLVTGPQRAMAVMQISPRDRDWSRTDARDNADALNAAPEARSNFRRPIYGKNTFPRVAVARKNLDTYAYADKYQAENLVHRWPSSRRRAATQVTRGPLHHVHRLLTIPHMTRQDLTGLLDNLAKRTAPPSNQLLLLSASFLIILTRNWKVAFQRCWKDADHFYPTFVKYN